ncbi:MAG TPA: T9SS type A sorting domain-containing protein, partial [Emticicia sp.]
ELGYAYENQQYPNPPYFAVFDHSKWSMLKWKDWAKTKYQTIRTLNSYWGTNYKQFSEVEPYVNLFNTKDSFRGLRGKDWYYFRHQLLKGHVDQMIAAVKSIDQSFQVACEFGGIADNLSLLRSSFAFKDLTEKAEIIKTSVDPFQADLVMSNLRPGQKFFTEIAHFDQATPESLRNYVDRAVGFGCEVIVLYVDYDNGKDVEKILPAVYEGVYWKDKPSPPIVYADSMKYRLSQLIDNREAVVEDWRIRSDNDQKRIKIIYDEDLIHDKQVIDNPLPDITEPDPGPGTNPDPGGPVVVNPPDPPKPPVQEGPNELPIENMKDYTQQIVVNQPFVFRIPENLYIDPDGYIAYIEITEAPKWVNFNKFEFSFYGKAPSLGKTKIKLKIYDNKGASLESHMFIESIPPAIDFELIKADYFDIPIEGWGLLTNNRTLYLEDLPKRLNVLARCNLDSVDFRFNLDGPYKFKNISSRTPYNLFGEGRGLEFPVGTYTLTANAFQKDTLITFKTVTFNVKYSTDSTQNIISDWVVYPNPFENVCNVKLPLEEDTHSLEFVLYTSSGKRIFIKNDQVKIVNSVAYIDLSILDVVPGSYILEVNKTGTTLKRIRVVKI